MVKAEEIAGIISTGNSCGNNTAVAETLRALKSSMENIQRCVIMSYSTHP